MIQFSILGPVELWVSGQRIDLGPARQRGVLAALVVEPQKPISLESLVGRVWDDNPPKHVRNVVYTYIARLRRTLADATHGSSTPVSLKRGAAGYVLGVCPDQVDLIKFWCLLSSARSAPPGDPSRSRLLSEALRLWRGEAFGGLSSEWAVQLRRSLQQTKFDALAQWADAEMQTGNSAAVLDALRRALVEDPLAEQLHERLVRALYLNGRGTDALRQFERARLVIADQLGTDPGRGLQELHQRLLRGQPPGGTDTTAERNATTVGALPQLPIPAGSGPDLLPMDLNDFTGRKKELAYLCKALTSDDRRRPPIVVITGIGGVGKTALAVRAAHEISQDFPDGRLYIDLHGKHDIPVSPRAVLGRLLRALGVESSWIPADQDARAELYRNRLFGQRALIVLDDAADDEQIRALLPGSRSCAVLLTSRALMGGTTGLPHLTLRELPTPQAVEMLARVAGRKFAPTEVPAAREVVYYCSGLPLAVRAVGTRMARRAHVTLSQLAVYLADEERRLDAFSYAACDVRASLDISYHRLDPVSSRLFRFLGASFGPGWEFTVAPMGGLPLEEVEEAYEHLAEMHLLQVVGRDASGQTRYRMLELYRAFARAKAASYAVAGPSQGLTRQKRSRSSQEARQVAPAKVQVPRS
jgi:DNA-binding SARP family transcriptional activator